MPAGRVIFVSGNQGMLVVQHEDGFAVVELLGSEGEFEVGDHVRGNWSALGGEPIHKDGQEHDAYFQGVWPGLQAAVHIARKTGGG